MSGTQPTMADAHPPGAQVFKLPSYCMPLPVDPPRPGIECGIGDSESDSEDDKPKRMYRDKGPLPSSPFDPGPPSPVSPRYTQKVDKDDSEDDQRVDRQESPIKKPKAQYPKGQYPVKLDKDGVWRYRPEEGDFKGHKSLSPSPRVEGPPSPVPVTPYANKRESPDEWPEDEAKLTSAPRKKAKKDKAKKGKATKKDKATKDKARDTSPLTWGPAYGSLPKEDKSKKDKAKKDKANAMSLSSYKGDIDENSSVVEVGKWVLHMNGLGWCGLDCSDIFEEHNINGSDLLQMTEEAINKLGLDIDDREIILSRIKTLQAKSKTKRSLDKAMDEV